MPFAAVAVACSLNPQPLPPESVASDAGVATGTDDGGGVVDAAKGPSDGGDEATDAADAGSDARADGADASDASSDAPVEGGDT